MAGPKSGAVVRVEILVEQNVILPVRIFLELLGSAIDGTVAVLIAEKDARQPTRNLSCHLKQRHEVSRTRGALDLEVVAVEQVEVHQTADQEYIHRHPDGPAPIRITPEHPVI